MAEHASTKPIRSRRRGLWMSVLGVLALAGIVGGSAWAWSSRSDEDGRKSDVEAVIAQANDEFDEALRWLERRADAAADELSRVIERNSPEQLLAAAAERLKGRVGGFEYRDGDAGEDWLAFDAATERDHRSTVLLVHGLDEPGDIWDELAPALAEEGHRVLRFNYANDHSPRLSADRLASFLENSLGPAGIDEIAIIGHSMGGLVSRDVLTRHMSQTKWDGPVVTRLITVGTPNRGSPVASLQPVGEARELVARLWTARTLDPSEMLCMLVDGSGEAAEALAEDSDYLSDLNSRPLPEGIPITIIAADASAAQKRAIDRLVASTPVEGLLSDAAVRSILAQVDHMTNRIGDGVVPVSSTALEGVADYTLVTANHRSMLRSMPVLSTGPIPPAIPIILDRLADGLADEPADQPEQPAGSGR